MNEIYVSLTAYAPCTHHACRHCPFAETLFYFRFLQKRVLQSPSGAVWILRDHRRMSGKRGRLQYMHKLFFVSKLRSFFSLFFSLFFPSYYCTTPKRGYILLQSPVLLFTCLFIVLFIFSLTTHKHFPESSESTISPSNTNN